MRILSIIINGMPARSRTEFLREVSNRKETIWYHLFKIIMCGKFSGYYDHWIEELTQYCIEIREMKCLGKSKITEEHYDTELWGGANDRFSNAYSRLLRKFRKEYAGLYPKKVQPPTVNQVYRIFSLFFDSYCRLLAQEKSVSKQDVYEAVEDSDIF